MAILKVFKSFLGNSSYLFKDGKQAAFLGGRYITGIEHEIKELEELVTNNHPHIYVDANDAEVDSEALTPMEQLKADIRAQVLAEMKAAAIVDPNNTSTSDNGNFAASLTTSANVNEGAAASNGDGVAANPSTSTSSTADAITAKLASLKLN